MPDPFSADPWLNIFEASHLSEAALFCVRQIKTAIQDRASRPQWQVEVTNQINLLLNLRARCTDAGERGEISVECALALYYLERYPEAEAHLKEAVAFYGAKWHQAAVAQWMMAGVQDKMPSGIEPACESMLGSLQLFAQQSQYCLTEKHKAWYRNTMDQIERELAAMSCPGGAAVPAAPEAVGVPVGAEDTAVPGIPGSPEPSGVSTGAGGRADPEEPGVSQAGSPGAVDVTSDETLLQLFRVVAEIPAGGFKAVDYKNYTVEEVSVNQVVIGDRSYRIHNLRGAKKVIAPSDTHCVVIKVVGNSMNKPSVKTPVAINDGDFVLLAEQNYADPGDIVAAEIEDDADSLATLKRYRVKRGKILLTPESTDPAFQHPFEFTANDPQVHIVGVALAVFKPLI